MSWPLLESVEFSSRVSGIANPKSSTGRIDVFTRLITDRAVAFDRIEPGYRGPLFAEISPRTFPVLVRKNSRLNQLRVRHGNPQFTDTQLKRLHAEVPLVDGAADIDNGLGLSIDLKGESGGRIGWRAKRHTGLIDVDPARGAGAGGLLGSYCAAAIRRHRAGSGRVLHPGFARGGRHPAGLRGRDGAVQSAGRRIPGALCGLLRPRFRLRGR